MLTVVAKDNYYYIPEKRLKTMGNLDTLLSLKERSLVKVVVNSIIHRCSLLVMFINDCEPEIFTTTALNLRS